MSESIYWIDADGGMLNLTDGTTYNVLQGVDGRFMPPYEFVTYEQYLVPGDTVKVRKTKPRDVIIPIVVYGSSETDLRDNLRMLTDAFDPTRGSGKLMVVTPDSKTLLLNCYYTDGMTLQESYDTGNCTSFRTFVASFTAHDPAWWNALENEKTVSATTYTSYFQLVFNDGDIDTYPIWIVSGPATDITLGNRTTGYYIAIGTALSTYQDVVRVDTRPATRSVLKNNQTDIFSTITTGSVFFPLIPGANMLKVTITGATDDTYYKIRWVDKYNGV